MYIGLYKTPNKALSCLVLSCLVYVVPGGTGTPHMKGVGMLVENFELNP